ncbi:hypothetical protein BaRGS_00019153 [Batillaria attramentaria]|uniref:Lipoprotein n=1 Tax=Batillaria attramentaria TaxID=370345 RepID=A0ABD0KRD9_9CAEN
MWKMILTGLVTLLVLGLGSCQPGDRFESLGDALSYGIQQLLNAQDIETAQPVALTYTGISSGLKQIDIKNSDATGLTDSSIGPLVSLKHPGLLNSDACLSVRNEGVKQIAHPTTCSAYVLCNDNYLNDSPFKRKVAIAEPQPCSAGTFWVDGVCQPATPTTNCAQKNRNRRFTDGYACNTYVSCEKNAEGEDVLVWAKCNGNGGQNERFDAESGSCVPDDTCDKNSQYEEEILFCVSTSGPLEGVSYYNKTSQPNSDGKTWIDYRWVLEEINTLVLSTRQASQGWAQFDGSHSLTSNALADNELAANFELSFTFQLLTRQGGGDLAETDNPNLSGAQTMALMSNSQDTPNCRSATLDVYLDAQRRIVAKARNVKQVEQVLTSDPIQSFRQPVRVSVRRENGEFILQVNDGISKTVLLGDDRLAATNCGLNMGKAFNRNNFVGVMDNVSLTRQCTLAELEQSGR